MARILCGGIATLDHVFQVHPMPSRAEKHRAKSLVVTGGGTAANAAVALARLGGEAVFVGALGDDRIGDEIAAGLEREGVDCARVRRMPGVQSPLSAIFVDPAGERMLVSYADPALPGSPDWLPDELPEGFHPVLGDTRWQAGSAHLFRIARRAGKFAVLDGDRAPREVPDLASLATHVAYSMQGLSDLTGLDDPRAALERLGPSETSWVGVTNGAHGVFFWEKGAVAHVPAFSVAAVDTLGAGDTWHGAFALALAEGASEREAVCFACAAAAIKCTRFGGRDGAPTRAEVRALLAGG